MSENTLTLEKRTLTGKKLSALRAEGKIPSVVYGGGKDPILTASDYNATEKALLAAGYHSTLDLDLAGTKQLAIVKNIDLDPVTRRIVNIEFQAVSADEVIEATTPIVMINFESSEAAKLHYAILQVMEEIEVKAKPSQLPKELTIDAAALAKLGDKLTIADLNLPEGVSLADKDLSPDQVIANLYDPAAEAAAREAEDKAAESESPAADSASESPESSSESAEAKN